MSTETDAKVDAFNHGYLVAVAKLVGTYGMMTVAFDLLRESGLRVHHAEALGIDEADLNVLRATFRILEASERQAAQAGGAK